MSEVPLNFERSAFHFLGLDSPVLPKLEASGQVVGDEERFLTVLAVVSCPRGAAPATCPLQPTLGWFGQLGGQ